MGSPGAPEPTLGPKTPLNGPGRAKIGVNAPHVVQLTGLGPKKNKFESVTSNLCSFHSESAFCNPPLIIVGFRILKSLKVRIILNFQDLRIFNPRIKDAHQLRQLTARKPLVVGTRLNTTAVKQQLLNV